MSAASICCISYITWQFIWSKEANIPFFKKNIQWIF